MSGSEAFTDSDGVQVAYRRWAASDRRASVVVAHGASEHSGRYARFATALTDAGYDVVAPDHRGHGETGASHGVGLLGPRGMAGVLDDVDHLVQQASGPVVMADVDEAIAGVQQAVDGGLADEPVDALGPFNEAFEPARTPFDWLTRDEAEVDEYLADPLCGAGNPLSYGYPHAVLSAVRDGATDIARLPTELPVLLVAGGRDPVSNGTEAVRPLGALLRDAGLTVTERYYPDARHEVLNETNRDEVERDILGWMSRTVG